MKISSPYKKRGDGHVEVYGLGLTLSMYVLRGAETPGRASMTVAQVTMSRVEALELMGAIAKALDSYQGTDDVEEKTG